MTHHLEFPVPVQSLLSSFAQETGLKEDEIISEAVWQYLEDKEDIRDAKAVLSNPGRQWTLDEVEKGIDLDR
ncbi:MAG: hypothetical protein WA902_18565 [Thermosynechococcaceae cyanobacterium]